MSEPQHPQPHSTLPEGSSAELAEKRAEQEQAEKERLVRRFRFPHWGGPLARVVFVVVIIAFFAVVFGIVLRYLLPFWKVFIERTVG